LRGEGNQGDVVLMGGGGGERRVLGEWQKWAKGPKKVKRFDENRKVKGEGHQTSRGKRKLFVWTDLGFRRERKYEEGGVVEVRSRPG